jgi:hypothetical protein
LNRDTDFRPRHCIPRPPYDVSSIYIDHLRRDG